MRRYQPNDDWPLTAMAGGGDVVSRGISSYRELPPPPELAAQVARLWVRVMGDDEPEPRARIVPDGCIDIVWSGEAAPWVAGPATRPVIRDLAPGAISVGVRFRPGMAPSVLGVPARELLDGDVPLREIWGVERWCGAARVRDVEGVAAKLAAAQATLRGGPAAAETADQLVRAAAAWLARTPGARTGDLSRLTGLSERQLLRRFEAAVGYGPKTLQRVLRFQRWLRLADCPPARATGLSGLAAAAGYADQAHLTREVSRLAGVPPLALLAERAGAAWMSDLFKTREA